MPGSATGTDVANGGSSGEGAVVTITSVVVVVSNVPVISIVLPGAGVVVVVA